VLFPADLAPTRAHVALPWIMAYDQEPLVTLASKRSVLSRAAAEGWLLVFEHDPEVACARAVPPGGGTDGCGLAEERRDEDRARRAGVVEPEDDAG
jgi:glyoxylase-like metal-dependent hydrolase (beta-lactamase superfamily II)